MIGILYLGLVLGVAILSVWVKDREYRIAAAIMLLGSFGTTLVYILVPRSWADGMPLIQAIDLFAAMAFITLGLFSRSFWPLWIAGFQIGALASHATIRIASDALPYAMGVLQGFWAWFQLMVLLGIGLQRLHLIRPATR
jgi:hypothetical protein